MANIQGLRTVIYRVADLKQATAWYTNVFETEPYFNEPFYVGFNIGGFELGLQPEESSEPKGVSVLTYWGVDNVAETFQRILSQGATPFEEPTEVGGGIVVAAVKDPWQNILGIIHNPHFKIQ